MHLEIMATEPVAVVEEEEDEGIVSFFLSVLSQRRNVLCSLCVFVEEEVRFDLVFIESKPSGVLRVHLPT